jgi:hypothetical protein
LNADQQIGQMYELMQAIQKQNQEDADAEEASIVNALDSHKSKPDQWSRLGEFFVVGEANSTPQTSRASHPTFNSMTPDLNASQVANG